MDLVVPRLINGVCVCKICCHVIWSTTYDCDSAVWSDPVNIFEELVGGADPGPCPDDVPWYQPGSDPCVRYWDAYYFIEDLCGECADVDKPAPPVPVYVPEGCCNPCCFWSFSAQYDCTTATWIITLTDYGMAPCSTDTAWVENFGSCICANNNHYTRTMYTVPIDNDCLAENAPDPGTPATPPFGVCQTTATVTSNGGCPALATPTNFTFVGMSMPFTDTCQWHYTDGAAGFLDVTYNSTSNTWGASVYLQPAAVGYIYGASPVTGLSCSGGVISGSAVLPFQSSGDGSCVGTTVTLTIP